MSVAISPFVPPNDPILKQIAKPIPVGQITGQETQAIIETMLQVAYGEQRDRTKPVLVGLAAPQIGISKRIILVDIGADGHGGVSNLQIFINPKITWRSYDCAEWYEGCFSTDRVCGIVTRPTAIRLTAYDRTGTQLNHEYTGYVARIFQHETDHLDGREFITHITNDANLHWVEKNEFPLYRDKEAWRTWPKKCPRKKWEQIKSHTTTK